MTAIADQTTFRGILLQGRSLVDDSPLGTFTDIDDFTRESFCDDPDVSMKSLNFKRPLFAVGIVFWHTSFRANL